MENHNMIRAFMKELPQSSLEPMLHVVGDVASSFSAFVIALNYDAVALTPLTDQSELVGFWEPPSHCKTPGVLVWIEAGRDCHVAIVYTREQARSIIRSMADWMGMSRRDRLLKKIATWNVPESGEPIQRFSGKAAELMYQSSLYAKMRHVGRR